MINALSISGDDEASRWLLRAYSFFPSSLHSIPDSNVVNLVRGFTGDCEKYASGDAY